MDPMTHWIGTRKETVAELRAEVEQLKAALQGRIEVATDLQMKCERLRAALRRADYWLQCRDNERIGITWSQDWAEIRALGQQKVE
jgi:regulator of replication initiation timing